MSKIQHQLANRLLPIIQEATKTNRFLSYTIVAIELGYSAKHARAIAQVCDLLDAAAVLARVPPLALTAVRETSGHFNRKAWKKGIPPGYRERIIERSTSHKFSADDFKAIAKALSELEGLGNRAAWALTWKKRPHLLDELVSIPLPEDAQEASSDAINDLGVDKPQRVVGVSQTYQRDPKVRKAVELRAKGKCEHCGKSGFRKSDGTLYVETHHIIALANDGADRVSNVIALCADHHREAHYGADKENLEKELMAKVKELHGNFLQ
jgi:hypothetical protein